MSILVLLKFPVVSNFNKTDCREKIDHVSVLNNEFHFIYSFG